LTEQNTKLLAQNKLALQSNKDLTATKHTLEEAEKATAELTTQLATAHESILTFNRTVIIQIAYAFGKTTDLTVTAKKKTETITLIL